MRFFLGQIIAVSVWAAIAFVIYHVWTKKTNSSKDWALFEAAWAALIPVVILLAILGSQTNIGHWLIGL